jgi:hypothetical protein
MVYCLPKGCAENGHPWWNKLCFSALVLLLLLWSLPVPSVLIELRSKSRQDQGTVTTLLQRFYNKKCSVPWSLDRNESFRMFFPPVMSVWCFQGLTFEEWDPRQNVNDSRSTVVMIIRARYHGVSLVSRQSQSFLQHLRFLKTQVLRRKHFRNVW